QLDGTHGFIAIGPYLPEEAPADELEALLVQGQIPLEEKPLYASYLQTLPVLPQPKLQAVLDAFALHLNGKKIDPLQRSLELTPENPSPCPVFDEDSLQARADMLALRYQRENEFLDAILRGDTGALRIMRPVNLNRLPNKLRNEKNQMFILNTLLRKAIESAHVHPYYIDQISAKWAVRLENAASLNELSQLTTDLVDDYSRLVQRHSLAHYTPTVRTMINFVNFNLSNPALTLQMIAEAMGASQSYLSRQFNKETGSSLPEFIKGQRIAQAKQLLRRSELLSIGQISVATGFSDMNYFAKVFRHATGMTPTEYRRGNKKSKPGAGARGEL
ncbi:MAG: AraC family transcriptional regulator, partial [Ruthenibacterium sp.]